MPRHRTPGSNVFCFSSSKSQDYCCKPRSWPSTRFIASLASLFLQYITQSAQTLGFKHRSTSDILMRKQISHDVAVSRLSRPDSWARSQRCACTSGGTWLAPSPASSRRTDTGAPPKRRRRCCPGCARWVCHKRRGRTVSAATAAVRARREDSVRSCCGSRRFLPASPPAPGPSRVQRTVRTAWTGSAIRMITVFGSHFWVYFWNNPKSEAILEWICMSPPEKDFGVKSEKRLVQPCPEVWTLRF